MSVAFSIEGDEVIIGYDHPTVHAEKALISTRNVELWARQGPESRPSVYRNDSGFYP